MSARRPVNRAELRRLAKLLCVEPCHDGPRLERHRGKWWLTRCVGGDTALPQTSAARTEREALDFAEAWLAQEVDKAR